MENEGYGLFRDYFALSSLITDEDWKWSNDTWGEETTSPVRPILGIGVKKSPCGSDMKGFTSDERCDVHSDVWSSTIGLSEPWKSDCKPVSAVPARCEVWSDEHKGYRDPWNPVGRSMDGRNNYSRTPVTEVNIASTTPKSSQPVMCGEYNESLDVPSYNGRDSNPLSSTGFFQDSGMENSRNTAGFSRNVTSFEELGRNLDIYSLYPQYSKCTDVEENASVRQMAVLLNRLFLECSNEENNRSRYMSSSGSAVFCAFCKRNKECREFYSTHVLKDRWGKVICPILRKYVCPICSATGDNAHTLRHCPTRAKIELPPKPSLNLD